MPLDEELETDAELESEFSLGTGVPGSDTPWPAYGYQVGGKRRC